MATVVLTNIVLSSRPIQVFFAFTYDEVVENFTRCNFVFSSTGEVCRDYRILDLTDGGEKGLEFKPLIRTTPQGCSGLSDLP